MSPVNNEVHSGSYDSLKTQRDKPVAPVIFIGLCYKLSTCALWYWYNYTLYPVIFMNIIYVDF